MVTSTLTRTTTITQQEDWDRRSAALLPKLLPLLERQPGFVSHQMDRLDDRGRMRQLTRWQTMDDCRAYLRNGSAAMAATLLDGFFPTAAFPNGTWLRETAEQPA